MQGPITWVVILMIMQVLLIVEITGKTRCLRNHYQSCFDVYNSEFWDCWPPGYCNLQSDGQELSCTDWDDPDCRVLYCQINFGLYDTSWPWICPDILNGSNGRKKRQIEQEPQQDLELSLCLRPVLELMSLLNKYTPDQ